MIRKKPLRRFKARANGLMEHAQQNKKAKLYEYGVDFLEKFHFSLYKGKHHTFIIDLARSYASQPIAIALKVNKRDSKQTITLFEARLSFLKDTVVIKSIQGPSWNINHQSPLRVLNEIREFDDLMKIPSSRYLIREIAEQAKKMKYKEIRLIRPEKHPSYQNPNWANALDKRGRELQEKIAFGAATEKEMQEYELHKNEAIKIIRARMKKLYDITALGEGFKKDGNYFIKKL